MAKLPKWHWRTIALFTAISSSSYSQQILWEKSYGGIHAEFLFDAVPTADFGFLLAGSSLSSKTGNKTSKGKGNLDYWIWKMDEYGELDWQKSFGGEGNDFLKSICLTNDGGSILAGFSDSPKGEFKKEDSRGEDYWVIKLDAGGGEQWQKTLGGLGQENLNSIIQTADGGYLLGGSSESGISGNKNTKGFGSQDFWIVKLGKEGEVKWEKSFGGIYFDEVRSIIQTKDQGYVLGGYSNSPVSGTKTEDNMGTGDYWIVKLDEEGNELWQRTLGGNNDDQLFTIRETYDGGLLLGGNSNSDASFLKKVSNGNGTDFYLLKLEGNGQILWQKTYDFGKIDILTSLIENKDHSILVGGYSKSETASSFSKNDNTGDYIALKISESGEVLWEKLVGSDGEDILQKAIETRDGGYLLMGTSNPFDKPESSKDSQNSKSENTNSSIKNNENGFISNPTSAAQDELNKTTETINGVYTESRDAIVDELKDATGQNKDSRIKFGLNTPDTVVGNPTISGNHNQSSMDKLTEGMASSFSGPQSKLPPSRDKKSNFGNSDYWVVKLKDKLKPEVVKSSIEAFPNPTSDYTNIIVGYEYQTGSATLFDISGRMLQQFEIHDRTVPINLQSYPEGIYLVSIKTNVQTDGIKVLKGRKR